MPFSQAPSYGSRRHKGPREGATCFSMAADEAVGCTHAFPMMGRSSQRPVCRGRSLPGLRVNDISQIHWSQHFLATQSKCGLIDELLA
ncbi:uncharacterized protein TNCV_4340771 [Trichonephila clavipes]|nr:uncharacterized protein TNCV_4340771 [Trichonephila clavipes]